MSATAKNASDSFGQIGRAQLQYDCDAEMLEVLRLKYDLLVLLFTQNWFHLEI